MINLTLPLVEVLVAVYRPNERFLREQLRSLNAQDYPHLRVLLLDDSGDPAASERIAALAREYLTDHPYQLARNEKNLGVSATFQKLTALSGAELLAYCDQDDVWRPDKVSRLAALLQSPTHAMAYGNLSIINGEGEERYPTLQAMNPRFTHRHGAGLFPYFLQDNCIPGCTLMVRSEIAKAALPFPTAYVHDQWLALCASAAGSIAYDPAPLIAYRLHSGNVIGMASLSGVEDRQSYVSARLMPQLVMLEAAAERFPSPARQAEIARQKATLQDRIEYVGKRKITKLPVLVQGLWRDPLRLGLEGLLGILPQGLGRRLIAFTKRH